MTARPALRRVLLVSLAAALAAIPMGCSPAATTSPGAGITLARAEVPRASADPSGATSAGKAINAFGFDLLTALEVTSTPAGKGPNRVISPASIALALGMARAGAKGQTATEMDKVLHDLATDEHAAWLNALDVALGSRSGTFKDQSGKDQPVTLRIANSTFSQNGMKLQDAFLSALASRYGAGVRLVDYKTNPEAARVGINAWVADQTEQRIKELLAAGAITPDTRLTLVNAVYLKAAWLTPFNEADTKDGPFTRADGSTVTAKFMNTIGQLGYAATGGWQAVDLPYVGGSLAMTLFVPDSTGRGLNAAAFDAAVAALKPRSVTLSYPRHSIESKLELEQVLPALGMPTAFIPGKADFSGMTTEEQLFISAVIHQANMDVDEKGTTAAAATAVVMRATALPAEPVTLRLDKPFYFALRDVPTGTILFLGRVTDPTAK